MLLLQRAAPEVLFEGEGWSDVDVVLADDPTRIDQRLVVTLDAQLFYGVLRALPYLVTYPYSCTEQILNRFLSTGIVSSVFDDYPAVARMARELAQRGHFPAIDVLMSLSRLMSSIAAAGHVECANRMRRMLAHWNEGRDLVEIGAYKPGTNPELDQALACMPRIEAFLQQDMFETSSIEETVGLLEVVFQAGA